MVVFGLELKFRRHALAIFAIFDDELIERGGKFVCEIVAGDDQVQRLQAWKVGEKMPLI